MSEVGTPKRAFPNDPLLWLVVIFIIAFAAMYYFSRCDHCRGGGGVYARDAGITLVVDCPKCGGTGRVGVMGKVMGLFKK